jgi:hypothetical protein
MAGVCPKVDIIDLGKSASLYRQPFVYYNTTYGKKSDIPYTVFDISHPYVTEIARC